MFDHIRGWALYRASTGTELLMHWYPDDFDTFIAEDGAIWTRISAVVQARTERHARELIAQA
jgi:hypothetical protein